MKATAARTVIALRNMNTRHYFYAGYRVAVLSVWMHSSIPPATAGEPSTRQPTLGFEHVVVDAQPPRNPWTKLAGDINGDGKPDIAIAGQNGPLVWYVNPGWQKVQVAESGWNTVGGAVGDVDGDGDVDIVPGAQVWFENPMPKGDPVKNQWRAHRISDLSSHDVLLVDLDRDGKPDLVSRDQSSFGHQSGNKLHFWQQAGADQWNHHVVDCPHGEGLAVTDLDRDGDADVVIGGRWFENDGRANGSWREHAFTTNWTWADAKIALGDLNGDGFADVVLAPAELQGQSYRLAWFEAPRQTTQPNWQEHIVAAPVEAVMHGLAVADMDGDGHLDIVAARMHQGAAPQEVGVYLNAGNGNGWKKVVVSDGGSHDILVADFNRDGRPDILGANHGGPRQPVELWLSQAPPRGAERTELDQPAFHVKTIHPRLLIEDVREMARRCEGPLADDYRVVKQRADAAVRRGGIEFISNGWSIPEDLMNCGLAFLVEREQGRKHRPYADVIVQQWGDGKLIENRQGSHFGYHALAYDWIYDALTPEQRVRYGNALGSWLRFYTDKPEILLKWGHWEYNQTWGPIHLNVMNCRDALTQKLLIALATTGAGTQHEADAWSFLNSWHQRVPSECLPAFDRMGGVWSESYGHGAYGPVTVIPYAFRAWHTATGIDYLKKLKPWGYPVEEPRWVAYTMMPHNERTAWIDDGDGSKPSAFARAAPMLNDGLSQWFSEHGRDWLRERWQRVACCDPSIRPAAPDTLPLGYLFPGAGHVYMRSAWNDPNATWAFFGAGPQFAGHARDDEGHFLICKQGALVSRQGGQGHNDSDYYSGGSLIYNLVTIFDPSEKFRRDQANENDGGLLRHIYESGNLPRARGHMVAFEHNPQYTYAAADLTQGYHSNKAGEVTRQFLYLRGDKEFFVVFDRVEATRAEFRRHFILHVPTEPEIDGKLLTWLSLPEADGDKAVLSRGRSRMLLRTVLPVNADIVKRGGPGQDAWGHPLEPTAQYQHSTEGRKKPPLCPWRIEVGDPSRGTQSRFLHVFEIGDESLRQATEVRFVAPAGVDIGDRWRVRFQATGPLGGQVGDQPLATRIQAEAQYSVDQR
jgi:hypothetical protein